MRKTTKLRYIKPESVRINDVVRYTYKDADAEISIVGRVGRRDYFGAHSVVMTKEGVILYEYTAGHAFPGRITLLEAAPEAQQPTLLGMEK